MATNIIDGDKLNACLLAEANAIRAKTGQSAQIAYDFQNNKGFADQISAISAQSIPQTEIIIKQGDNIISTNDNSASFEVELGE